MTKNTDCLFRKVLGWFRENGYQIVAMTSMLLAGYFLHSSSDKKATMEVNILNKEGGIVWSQSVRQKSVNEVIEISAPLRTTDTAWFGVGAMEIKHADRVVVRLK